MGGGTEQISYLRFTAQTDNSTIALNKQGSPIERVVEYAINGGSFATYIFGNTITLNTDEYVEWRRAESDESDDFSKDGNNYYYFSATGKFYHSGLFTTLLRWNTNLATIETSAFYKLLYNVSAIIGGDGIVIPNGVVTIKSSAFSTCNSIYGILSLPNTLTDIYSGGFINCTHLTGDLIIPQNCVVGGSAAYYHSVFGSCGFNGKLVVPGVNKTIWRNTYNSCKFAEIHLEEGIEFIYQYSFSADGLTHGDIFCPPTPPVLQANNCFNPYNKRTFYIPYSADHSILTTYQTAQYWDAFVNYMIELGENGEIPS